MGSVPMLFVIVFTHPYVGLVLLRLPDIARKSPASLRAFVNKLPQDTMLHMVRINLFGMEKHNVVRLRDLRTVKPSFLRIENMVASGGKRGFFGFGNRFYVQPVKMGQEGGRVPGVWQEIMKVIQKQSKVA
jgi:hypothetical protein